MMISVAEEGLWFYYQLGRTITSWAHVEQELCWVGCCSFAKENQMQFIATFFSIENFRSKLQVVDRLVAQNFKEYSEQWELLKTNTERLSKVRNQLAHYPVMNYGNDTPGSRIALLPRFGAPSKFKQVMPKPPSGSLRLSEIAHAQKRFTSLMFRLRAFRHQLSGEKDVFPATASDEPKAPRLADIAKEMRSMQKDVMKQ